jgi:hypothetical protein
MDNYLHDYSFLRNFYGDFIVIIDMQKSIFFNRQIFSHGRKNVFMNFGPIPTSNLFVSSSKSEKQS